MTPDNDQIAEGPGGDHGARDGSSGFSVDDATITLSDDDTASTSVSLSLDPTSVSEGDSPRQVGVTAELNEAAGVEPTVVNVTVGHTEDAAVSGMDYDAVAGFAVTIPAGQTSGTGMFALTLEDHQIAEGAETITVHGTASNLSVDEATLTLNDDDTLSTSVSLSLDPAAVSENAGSVSVEVTAELNEAAGTVPTVVNVTVGHTGDAAASGTDYDAVAGFAVTIPAGRTSGSASFTLTPEDDQIAEGAEEITIHGTSSGLTVDDATLTLNDDDTASTAVTLSLNPTSVSEGDGPRQVEVTAELNEAAGTAPTTVEPSPSGTAGTPPFPGRTTTRWRASP